MSRVASLGVKTSTTQCNEIVWDASLRFVWTRLYEYPSIPRSSILPAPITALFTNITLPRGTRTIITLRFSLLLGPAVRCPLIYSRRRSSTLFLLIFYQLRPPQRRHRHETKPRQTAGHVIDISPRVLPFLVACLVSYNRRTTDTDNNLVFNDLKFDASYVLLDAMSGCSARSPRTCLSVHGVHS